MLYEVITVNRQFQQIGHLALMGYGGITKIGIVSGMKETVDQGFRFEFIHLGKAGLQFSPILGASGNSYNFV